MISSAHSADVLCDLCVLRFWDDNFAGFLEVRSLPGTESKGG
jgi:hypothetical protein